MKARGGHRCLKNAIVHKWWAKIVFFYKMKMLTVAINERNRSSLETIKQVKVKKKCTADIIMIALILLYGRKVYLNLKLCTPGYLCSQ